MSIPLAQISAHLCSICLLLFSVTSVLLAGPTRSLSTTTTGVDFENKTSHFGLPWKKDKCQYNLTDSSQSLKAKSSVYQDLGFSRCEYIIQATDSHFLLINLTDVPSHSDMPVGTGVQVPLLQQAATETTTTNTESQLSKTLARKPPRRGKVNSTTIRPHKELSSSAYKSRFAAPSSPSNLHISKKIIGYSNDDNNTSGQRLVTNNSLEKSLINEHSISKNSIGNSDKDTKETLNSEGNKHLRLTTAAAASDVDSDTDSRAPNCSLKLIIEEIESQLGSKPQIICWEKSWEHRIPLVFKYSVPIRITYVWDSHSQRTFSLDFRFLRREEVDCHFRCNNYLCLPQTRLCDGIIDCPDHSDEDGSKCAVAREHHERDEPHVINITVIVIFVILSVVILILIFMIIHSRCCDGARRGGDSLLQAPHSQSSEVCRSPSGSIQENGQYAALLHQHPQRQTAIPNLMAGSSHCVEHQQLLHQHHHEDAEQHQYRRLCALWNRPLSRVHQLCPLHTATGVGVPPGTSVGVGSQQHPNQQRLMHHQQPVSEHLQQRKHKQTRVNPDELYPPNIPFSADGEEGYAMSQKSLHSKQQLERNWQMENEMFRPPPNKTVYDRDSPPPPYSHSPPRTKPADTTFPSVDVVSIMRQDRSSATPTESPAGACRNHSMSCHH